MGIVVYSLLLVVQDFARQPFHSYSGAGGVLKGLTAVLHCSTVSFSTPSFYHYHSPPTKETLQPIRLRVQRYAQKCSNVLALRFGGGEGGPVKCGSLLRITDYHFFAVINHISIIRRKSQSADPFVVRRYG